MAGKSLEDVSRNQYSSDFKQIEQQVIDAMTTNETSFFRDTSFWNMLQDKLLPEMFKEMKRTVKLWCGAASIGQEPYSLAMSAVETQEKHRYFAGKPIAITASDLSTKALKYAYDGIYNKMEVNRGVKPDQVKRWFTQQNDNAYKVSDSLQTYIDWQQVNLIKPFVTLAGPFDIITMRNVLIYFTPEQKKDILKRAASLLSHKGYLFLGSTENVDADGTGLVRDRCHGLAVYRRG